MNTTINKTPLRRSSIAFAAMIAVWTPASSWSAEPTEGKETKMQAEMRAQDTEFTAAVTTMNSAAPDNKLDLVASLVTRLVEQLTAMHVQNAKMEEKMMKHMMGHMEMGKESMSKCPMMKGMAEKFDADHAEHHEKPE